MRQLIFALVLAVGMGGLGFTVLRLIRFMWVGRAGIPLDRIPARLGSVVIYWLLQRKVMEKPMDNAKAGFTSLHHLAIFWGFLIVTAGTMELWINGLSGLSYALLPAVIYHPLEWLIDVFNLIVLVAIGYGFFRRLVVKPRLIPMSLDAGIILSAIAGLMITHFFFHGFHMVTAANIGEDGPVSSVVAGWFGNMPVDQARIAAEAFWWAHIVLGLAFLNYVPYSKHIHILGALPNIFFRNLGQRGVMPKLNLEDETDWGVGKIESFNHKSLMDQYACTECARCSNYCPAFNTQKPLSPMHLIHDLRDEMLERGAILAQIKTLEHGMAQHANPSAMGLYDQREKLRASLDELPALVGGRIKEETLWACTTCGACQEVCPVFIDHPLKILQRRT